MILSSRLVSSRPENKLLTAVCPTDPVIYGDDSPLLYLTLSHSFVNAIVCRDTRQIRRRINPGVAETRLTAFHVADLLTRLPPRENLRRAAPKPARPPITDQVEISPHLSFLETRNFTLHFPRILENINRSLTLRCHSGCEPPIS